MATPRGFAVLGQLHSMIVEDARGMARTIKGLEVLASSSDGRDLYCLSIRGGADKWHDPESYGHRGVQIADRRRTWAGGPVGVTEGVIPEFTDPVELGRVVLLRYWMDRGEGLAVWEHYFSSDDRPAYPVAFNVGHGQIWIRRGAFVADATGIRFLQSR